jgi:uncharacterized protein involved in outer membrane biogenesis
VTTRCAAMAFDVNQGVMASRALVLDTNDTVFTGNAKVDFAREAMDIYVKPEPKDHSILSLRSPLEIGGTFGAPKFGLDKMALAKRALRPSRWARSIRCWRWPPRSRPVPATTSTASAR